MRRVGLGLGADRIAATSGPSGELWTRPLESWSGGMWDDLGAALGELKSASRVKRALVSVALLPPLVEVKRLEFPPLRTRELERVLARDAVRYFLQADGRTVVGTMSLVGDRGARRSVLAAAASAALVEELYRQVERVGWSVARVVPAHAAWARLPSRMGEDSRDRGTVVVAGPVSLDVLEIIGGCVKGVRRLPRLGDEAVAASVLAEAGNQQVVKLGTGGADPHAAAATFATRAAGPELIPDAVAMAHQRSVRVLARALLAASVVLLASAAGLEWLGLRRELARVSQRREEIRSPVARAMAARSATNGLRELVRTLETAQTGLRRWPTTLGHLATSLPADAHLIALHADADSVRVEGLAEQAAGVMHALQRAPIIGSLRADAPIRRETGDSGAPVEHFLLSGRLLPPGADPSPGGER